MATKIRVAHQVKGRIRFRIADLRGSGAVARLLESGIGGAAGIDRATANPLTGSLLIHYRPPQTVKNLTDRLEGLLRAYVPEPIGGAPYAIADPVRGTAYPAVESDSWHLLETEEVIRRLGTVEGRGLSEEEAAARAGRYGENRLPTLARRTLSEILRGQSLSWPVLLMAGASGFSLLAGRVLDGLLTLGVTLVNVGVAAVMERRAERSLQRVSRQVSLTARVVRDGAVREVAFETIVPGDLLDLELGTRIPADARLIRAEHLGLNEAALTGESIPQSKSSQRLNPGDWPITQRRNMVFRGTRVVEGRGRALAVATGVHTVLGRLQHDLGAVFPPEAVAAGEIKQLTRHFLRLALGASAVNALILLLRGYGLSRVLWDTLALIAGAIPSGISTLALSAFALGHVALRKKRILIHRLRVLGNLASIQLVCFDKTGTLTYNRMAAAALAAGGKRVQVSRGRFFTEEGQAFDPRTDADITWLITCATLCNEVLVHTTGPRSLEGSSTEKALIVLAEDAGLAVAPLRSDHPLLDIRHRREKSPFMMTIHRWDEGRKLTVIKGSPPEVLELCRFFRREDGIRELAEEDRERIELENSRMSGAGLRVLGVAYDWGRVKKQDLDHPESSRLIWAGLVGLMDPLRPGARETIAALHRAGIRTAVITGDQSLTAYHIGEELGLSGGAPLIILDALNLKGMSRAGLTGVATQAHIFARLSPTQKQQIIQAYQNAGLRVAMVGDGFNDVLALKVADVGLAMGREGADLARHTADLVIEDDDLRKVTAAIAEGRTFYENLRKSIRFLVVNGQADLAAELLSGSGPAAREAGVGQQLWTNLACLALALDPPEQEIMEREYAVPEKGLLSGREWAATTPEALALLGGAGAAGAYGFLRYGTGQEAGRLFQPSLAINQLLYAETCRTAAGKKIEKRPPNPMLRTTLVLALGSTLAPFLISALGGGPAAFLARLTDLLALGLGGLLSRAFLDRPIPQARPGKLGEFEVL